MNEIITALETDEQVKVVVFRILPSKAFFSFIWIFLQTLTV